MGNKHKKHWDETQTLHKIEHTDQHIAQDMDVLVNAETNIDPITGARTREKLMNDPTPHVATDTPVWEPQPESVMAPDQQSVPAEHPWEPQPDTNPVVPANISNWQNHHSGLGPNGEPVPVPSPIIDETVNPVPVQPSPAQQAQLEMLADTAAVKGTLSAVAAEARTEYESLNETARGEFHAAVSLIEQRFSKELKAVHHLFGAAR